MVNSITPLEYLDHIKIAEKEVNIDPDLAQTIIWFGDKMFDNSLLSKSPYRYIIKRRHNNLISSINHSMSESIEINKIKRLAGIKPK